MPIQIVPYLPEHETSVKALNARLAAGGSTWGFYDFAIPRWAPPGQTPHAARALYLAIDEAGATHAGYCLKTQTFLVGGVETEAASFQGPVSEGLVDPRYSMLGMRLVRDMERRSPLLFAWGATERLGALLKGLGWNQTGGALVMRIVRAERVLRLLPQIRRKPAVRSAAAMLAATGLAQPLVSILQSALGLFSGGAGPQLKTVQEAQFGPWADEVWQACRDHYGFLAVRDAQTMNVLALREDWPHAIILRMEHEGRTVGWAALRDNVFPEGHRYAGLRIGSLIDSLAEPGFEAGVIEAATRFLQARGVDMVISVYTHRRWLRGFARAGYLVRPNWRPLNASSAMTARLAEVPGGPDSFHLTPLDGDGPHGF
jgi:hypothetical protein